MALAGALWVCLTLSIGQYVSERLHRRLLFLRHSVVFSQRQGGDFRISKNSARSFDNPVLSTFWNSKV
jgi:ribosomal protein L17